MKTRVNNVLVDENGYPVPKKVKCFKCQKGFILKFLAFRQNYTHKNTWGYWTEKKQDQVKYICDACLRNLYLNEKEEYKTAVKASKKSSFRSYFSRKII